MKKILLLISMILLTSNSFADTNQPQDDSISGSIQSGWNSFIDVLAGKKNQPSENKTNAPQTTTAPKPATAPATSTPEQNTKSNNNPSAYTTIKSGWNSFVDFLTGTKR